MLRDIWDAFAALIVIVIVVLIIGVLVWLPYHAYCLRFPHAPGWTYFFH